MYILEKAKVRDDQGHDIAAEQLKWCGVCMHPSQQYLYEARIELQVQDNNYYYRVREMKREEVTWHVH